MQKANILTTLPRAHIHNYKHTHKHKKIETTHSQFLRNTGKMQIDVSEANGLTKVKSIKYDCMFFRGPAENYMNKFRNVNNLVD